MPQKAIEIETKVTHSKTMVDKKVMHSKPAYFQLNSLTEFKFQHIIYSALAFFPSFNAIQTQACIACAASNDVVLINHNH